MNVSLIIARKEVTELARDARSRWTSGLLILLMFTALALGWQQMRRNDFEQQAASATSYQQWLDQGVKNPHSAAHFGQYAFKPANPLSFVDPGVTAFTGTAVWMEAHKQNEFRFRPARDATSLQRFGELSIAFILQVLFPLLIILLTFSAFSGERERGTLRQLLSIGVQPFQLLVGKLLAFLMTFGMTLLPVILLGLLAIVFADMGSAGWNAILGRALLMSAGYAIYLFGFCALTLGVSATLRTSRQVLVVLLAFWVLNSFFVPRIMTDFLTRAYPLPTSMEFQNRLDEARKTTFGHDQTHPAYIAFRERVLKQYGVARVEDLPFDFGGLALREDDENGYRIYDRLYGELWENYARQERVRALAGFAFPLVAMQAVSMGFAGTDTAHQNHFAQSAEGYRRLIQTTMSEDLIQHRKNGDENYVADRSLWKTLPSFQYQMPTVGIAMSQQLPNMVILFTWAFATGMFALRAVRRLRPVWEQ